MRLSIIDSIIEVSMELAEWPIRSATCSRCQTARHWRFQRLAGEKRVGDSITRT